MSFRNFYKVKNRLIPIPYDSFLLLFYSPLKIYRVVTEGFNDFRVHGLLTV